MSTRPLTLAAAFAVSLTIGGSMLVSPTDQARAEVCDPNYAGVCLPVFTGTDNVNCIDDIVTLSSFPVVGTDVYGLDGADDDGIACESNGKPAYQAPAATPTATATSTSTPTATTTTATSTATAAATATPTSTNTPAATSTPTTLPPTATPTSAAAVSPPSPPSVGNSVVTGDGFSSAYLAGVGALIALAGAALAFVRRKS